MTIETVRDVAELCKQAVEGMEAEPNSRYAASHQNLASKLRYLSAQAGAAWTPEFDRMLNTSHSLRIVYLENAEKELYRSGSGVCMACGREERNCDFALDLAGNISPDEWFKSADNVASEYELFAEEYANAFKTGAKAKRASRRSGCCHELDHGRFVVGETCLRKASLKFQINTLFLEMCYYFEHVDNSNTDEFAKEALKKVEDICTAVADDKRAYPDVAVDFGFWTIVDGCREAAAEGAGQALELVVFELAKRSLRGQGEEEQYWKRQEKPAFTKRKHRHEAHPGSDDKNGSDCRKKRCVVVESESEGEYNADETGGEAEVAKAPVTRARLRSCTPAAGEVSGPSSNADAPRPSSESGGRTDSSHVPGAGVFPDSAGGVAGGEEEELAPPESVAFNQSGRAPPPSITSVVAMQRARGSLPSRRGVILDLMELQVKMQRRGDFEAAALLTNATLTLQELVARVEELAHSHV